MRYGTHCRGPVQERILAKRIDVYAIDAARIAREAGMAGRTNTVLQTCFFAISGVLPRDEAIAKIKEAIAKRTRAHRPEAVFFRQSVFKVSASGTPRGSAGSYRSRSMRQRPLPAVRPG
jgi:pyruvate-ferredoxin/flavodoxin oxidoreductase